MKSKYFLTLFLIGVLPLLALAGVYYWMALTEAPAPTGPATTIDSNALHTTIPILQTQLASMASSLKAAIVGAYQDVPALVANHTDTDLDNFVKTHNNGIEGVAVFTMDGKLLKTFPATAQLADPAYGSSEEFQKMISKFKDDGGKLDLFFSTRLNYPAFIFSIPLDSKTVVEAVLNLSRFFRDIDPKGGEIFMLDAGSGQYFYHSNPAKLQTPFNPDQQKWLNDVQQGLMNKQTGSSLNPPLSAAVYTPLGIKDFGLVHTIPFSVLQPAAPAPSAHKVPIQGLPEVFQTPTGMTVLIAAAACMGWIFLVGAICFGMILSPLKKASALVVKAAQGSAELNAQTTRSFGKDEVGQMVQAAAQLMQKLENDKQQANQEKEEALRRGRAEVDAKTREAANQVSAAQQAAATAKNEANEKNQLLNDKLKELDALKGMSEGLRNQTEQAKAEIGKLKSQVTASEDAKAEAQKKLTQTQAQMEDRLREMESKLLTAVASSSAIQVSQVRAAAIRTMAEELKTTLGIIKGYVSSALGSTQGGISEKQQEFLGMVINRSARLEKFINDLLDIYQVEIELEKATYEEVNLASEIEGLAFNFQAQSEVKNIKMKVEAKGNIPKVPVVRRRFNQLWNILYLQIIKDAPRGSTIPITVEPIGDNAKVTLQDPGLIVTPEALPRLFDEFYDPKHPASPQLAGTGLKFALVKTILAAHGGGAVAEKADQGTRLILTFPNKIKKPGEAPKAAVAAAPAPPPPPPGAGLRPAASAAPTAAPSFGLPKPATPGLGVPKPAVPPLGVPKPAGAPGALDSLISKVPPVTAPGLRPSPAVPGAAAPPAGAPLPPKPPTPAGPTPAAPGVPPAAKPPGLAPTPGIFDALLDKKVPAPGVPRAPAAPAPPRPATPAGPVPSAPGIPGVSAPRPVMPPSMAPGVPGMAAPGAPAAPRPAVPGAPVPAAPGVPAAPRPVVPGVPPSAAPTMPPRPAAAPVPGTPPPAAPRPVMPPTGMPGAPTPAAPSMAPKVVPTNIKPTTPPPGILDLDNFDGMKTDAGTPKAPVPPAGAARPPIPGAPPMGAPKPATPPGIPPGGLDASKAQKAKDGEGDLIE